VRDGLITEKLTYAKTERPLTEVRGGPAGA
jgi:hypothetical protein